MEYSFSCRELQLQLPSVAPGGGAAPAPEVQGKPLVFGTAEFPDDEEEDDQEFNPLDLMVCCPVYLST